MIGAEEARRASSRRGGGEGARRGGVGDKNNLNEACVRVFCVCESDKKRSCWVFLFFFCQSAAASSLGEISRATRGGLFDCDRCLTRRESNTELSLCVSITAGTSSCVSKLCVNIITPTGSLFCFCLKKWSIGFALRESRDYGLSFLLLLFYSIVTC